MSIIRTNMYGRRKSESLVNIATVFEKKQYTEWEFYTFIFNYFVDILRINMRSLRHIMGAIAFFEAKSDIVLKNT